MGVTENAASAVKKAYEKTAVGSCHQRSDVLSRGFRKTRASRLLEKCN
jgi:hypothetical protein